MAQGITNKIQCNGCKSMLDGFTSVEDDDSKPKDDDLSICAFCGAVGKYTNNVTEIQPLSEVELALIKMTEPETARDLETASRTITLMRKLKGN